MNFLPLGIVLVLIFLVTMIFISIKAPNRTRVVLSTALGVGVVFRILESLYGTSGAFNPFLSAIAGVIICSTVALAAFWITEGAFSYRNVSLVAVVGFFLGAHFGLAVLVIHTAGLVLLLVNEKKGLFNSRKFPGHPGDISVLLAVLVVSLFSSLRTEQVVIFLAPIGLALTLGLAGNGRITEARKLIEAKNYDEAIELLRKLLRGNPKDPKVNCEMGHALLLTGRLEDALSYLDRAIEQQQGGIAQLYKGLALIQLKQYSEAIPTLNNFLESHPDDLTVLVAVANAYYHAGKFEAALKAYNRVLELRPGWCEILNTRAAILFDQGMYTESINDYTAIIKLEGESYESLMKIAKGYECLKDKSAMEQAYRRVLAYLDSQLRYQPDSGQLLGEIGLVHMKLGEWAKALEMLDRAIVINPSDYNALNNKSLVLCELNRYDLAVEYAEKAIKLAPTYTHWVSLGNALRGLKKPTQALASFDKALNLDPDGLLGLWGKALVLFDLGDFVHSLEWFGKHIRIAGDNVQSYLFMGRCLMGLKKYREALQAFDYCVSAQPNNATGWYYKGTVNLFLGEVKQAMQCLQKTIKLNPENLAAYYNLSRIQATQGLTAEALKNLMIVIQKDRRYVELVAKDGSFDNLRQLKEFNKILDLSKTGHPD